MRRLIAVLCVFWIIGIASGVFHASYAIFVLSLILFFSFTRYLHIKIQVVCAVAGLFMLGHLYGAYSGHGVNTACRSSNYSRATLAKTYALSPKEARYMFIRNDGCALLVYTSRFPVLVRGTIADIRGKEEPPSIAFTSLPDYAQFLIDNGITFVVRNASVDVIANGNVLSIDSSRVSLMQRIDTIFAEPDASILIAMLLGDKGMISTDIKAQFQKSGVSHILAISGLHVSILAGITLFILSSLPIPSYIRTPIMIGLLWTYVWAIGLPASAVRAAVFWTGYLLAYRARALVSLPTILLATLTVLMTHDPYIILSVGFELSVTAVMGICVALFFSRRIRIPQALRGVSSVAIISLGATVMTAPLTMYYFGGFSIIGVLVNVLVVPVLPFLLIAALVTLCVYSISIPIAFLLSFGVHGVMTWILSVTEIASSIPYGYIDHARISSTGIFIYYSAVAVSIIAAMQYYKLSWKEWWI